MQEGTKDKKLKNFTFRKARCSLRRAQNFSCSFEPLYWGLNINLFHLLKQNSHLFNQTLSSKTWIWIRIQIHPKGLYPDPDSSNMDPQYHIPYCWKVVSESVRIGLLSPDDCPVNGWHSSVYCPQHKIGQPVRCHRDKVYNYLIPDTFLVRDCF